MIRSKYFPAVEACISDNLRGEDKIEIPADVYDTAVREGKIAADDFIRGDYDYETAKIFAESKRVDALKFDTGNGEIKTSSKVGISAEIIFALAIWNGYDRETAIERTILSQMNKTDLPESLADKVSEIKIVDEPNVAKDLGKYLAGKSSSYVDNKIRADRAVNAEVFVNVPRVPQIVQGVGDTVGDVISAVSDEIVLVCRYGENILDLRRGRISAKQFGKNTAVIAVGVTGAGAGWTVGGLAAAAAGLPAALGVGTALAASYAFKAFYRKFAKSKPDMFIREDSEKMREIFFDELTEMLDGKFLTQYEIDLLLESVNDAITAEKWKDMYQRGSLSAQKQWAHEFIERHLQGVEGQRLFVIMPEDAEWQAGLQRVADMLDGGEDIAAKLEQQRVESLAQRRKFLAEKYNLKQYETAQAMSIINPLVKTQLEIGRSLAHMQRNEANFQAQERQLMDERAALKKQLNGGK